MATPLERMRTAWKSEGRLALHRVVEEMAREGVTRAALDEALDALLDEARAAGVDDDTEEEILGVGDRLSGWCLASQRIVTQEGTLPTEEEIAKLPRWARVAFAARCARRVLPVLEAQPQPVRPGVHEDVLLAIGYAEQIAKGLLVVPHLLLAGHSYLENPTTPATARAVVVAALAAARSVTEEPATVALAITQAAACDLPGLTAAIRRDFDHLVRLAKAESWDDETEIPPSVFGPMWPDGLPAGWPPAEQSGDIVATPAGSPGAVPGEAITTPNLSNTNPLIDVYFAEGDFSAEDMQLFLGYLAATYRDLGGTGLKVVEQHTEVFEAAEVPR